jgi:hypothetical protein
MLRCRGRLGEEQLVGCDGPAGAFGGAIAAEVIALMARVAYVGEPGRGLFHPRVKRLDRLAFALA